jgi:hypothetical protein
MTMKTSRVVAFTVAMLVAFVALAKTTTPAKPHGMDVRGTITALDEKGKTLTITPAKGTARNLVWNDATKVENGPLAKGETANARYIIRDHKDVATVIVVQKAEAKGMPKTAPKH